MASAGQHDEIAGIAGKPLRRGRAWAWTVFTAMASVSVLFNVNHDLTVGRMPWVAAYPAGILPLLLSIGALEIAAVWPLNKAKAAAWAVTVGAMGWSASAIGGVVLNAAPPHMELLFGLLADGAALLAVSFLLNGPSAAHETAKVTAKITELAGQAHAEKRTRLESEAQAARMIGEMRAAHETERETARQAHEELRDQLSHARAAAAATIAVTAERDAARAELAAARTERDAAAAARKEAERAAAAAVTKAERIARRAVPGAPKESRKDHPAAVLSAAGARDAAYLELDKDQDLTGRELGEKFGMGERWGQMRKAEYEQRHGLRAVGGA